MPENNNTPIYILDSFAMLAFLGGENGMVRVKEVLQGAADQQCKAAMSLINLGEVLYITEREVSLAQAQAVLAAIEQLPLTLLPVEQKDVLTAAHLKANYPIAYADAFVIAAALETGGTVLTGDPEFKAVENQITIEWFN
jgi:ribonuclease VapC